MRLSQDTQRRGAPATLVTTLCLSLLAVAGAAEGAKAPQGRTYFTAFVGLEEQYDISTDCLSFGPTELCSLDGRICGSWLPTDTKGRERAFAFELFFLEDDTPVALEGQARLDTRGAKSSIGGAGRISGAGPAVNFSFAGRQVAESRCQDLLEGSSDDGQTLVVGSGNVVTESREVQDFSGVAISGVGRLVIRHTGSETLSVTADDNILPHLISEVRNGRLFLSVEEGVSIRSATEILYELTVRELDELTVSGAAAVDAEGIDTELFRLQISGAAVVVVEGAADRQEINIAGASLYEADGLASRTVAVNMSGASAAVVRVSDELTGQLSGACVLEYIGDPVVNVTTAGASVVRKIG